MMQFKFVLRLIVAIILILPSIPFFWFTMSACGIGFAMAFIVFLEYIFSWLVNNKERMKEITSDSDLLVTIITAPFVFWYKFVKGEPFNL